MEKKHRLVGVSSLVAAHPTIVQMQANMGNSGFLGVWIYRIFHHIFPNTVTPPSWNIFETCSLFSHFMNLWSEVDHPDFGCYNLAISSLGFFEKKLWHCWYPQKQWSYKKPSWLYEEYYLLMKRLASFSLFVRATPTPWDSSCFRSTTAQRPRMWSFKTGDFLRTRLWQFWILMRSLSIS